MVAASLVCGACQVVPQPKIASADTDDAPCPDAGDPFAPVELRIHPLTAVNDRRELLAHIELLDRYGDTVKGLGTLTLELAVQAPGFSTDARPRHTQRWEVDLRDPAASSRRFDRVTRTYRFRLQGAPRWDTARQRALLTAVFTTLDGHTLRATSPLPTP
ncbi:MAG: hypothetical protein D6824_05385 [Planctomycetota bacterium]|nr:MAG: hypothetical protein D6824_05385 [Planctomycetota bacterium]